ncbi:ABC transporter ATP-binding protein [Hylemonella gracilis]|uniref:ABC transporter ATP-binding protein n=1 Tax=Hylemonella gracilis ATCC 19624 TaxID=887062 RepID=F3KWX2_9BURK|nr:ABC transporter ATP-binding protein [Hylemonella gracilis]EGI75759.1 ABC transporter ATP-binding protein [Hylemonella gracilis ATCC 19624]
MDTSATPAAPRPLARLRGLRKNYHLGEVQVPALRGIDLDITAGGFTVIAGPSGSGKSTLLHVLGCIDRPDAGQVEIDGITPRELNDDQLSAFRARRIGFVFQNFNLLPVLNALENVEYPMRLLERDGTRRRQRARELLAAVGLQGMETRRPNQLSGGQRQRVAIARALANAPGLVLADEPTANLDRQTGADIIALMRRIQRETGASFVFSSHDPALIQAADVLVRIADGQIVPPLTPPAAPSVPTAQEEIRHESV